MAVLPLRRRSAEPAPYVARQTITASAARLNLRKKQETDEIRQRTTATVWQEEAWQYYDAIGEIKFAFGLEANVLSRLRLYAAVVTDPEAPPSRLTDAVSVEKPDGENPHPHGIDPKLALLARDTLNKTLSKTSLGTFMRAFTLNMAVPGEGYCVMIKDRWHFKSTAEVTVDGTGQAYLQESKSQGQNRVKLPANTPIGRVWRNHPRNSKDPDSSMLGVLGDCEELLLYSRMIRKSIRARMNAGILYVPDGISVAARTPEDQETEEEAEADENSLEQELTYALTEPVEDESSSASIIPLLLRGPADMADQIKYIELHSKSDEALVAKSERALERILQGLDVPKDLVTGLANVKYSNAIQIDENLYKAHIEPLAVILCEAVTEIILRPQLAAAAKASGEEFTEEDLAKIVVWYDPSEITVKPNRSEDADTGYSHYLLSGDAWRREHGFSDQDAPDENEIARRMALEKAELPPEMAAALFNLLLPNILKAAQAQNAANDPNGGLPADLQEMLGQTETPMSMGQVAEPVGAQQ
jgi:hypothetical protein